LRGRVQLQGLAWKRVWGEEPWGGGRVGGPIGSIRLENNVIFDPGGLREAGTAERGPSSEIGERVGRDEGGKDVRGGGGAKPRRGGGLGNLRGLFERKKQKHVRGRREKNHFCLTGKNGKKAQRSTTKGGRDNRLSEIDTVLWKT